MPLSAGQMRKRIRIEQRTSTRDSYGEQVQSWSLVCERWAAIVKTPGIEVWASEQRLGRVPTTYVMRYPRDITILPQMRLTCDGALYDIKSAIDPDGMKAELHITCMQLVNDPIEGSTGP